MPPSSRGQLGPHSLFTLLALSAGQAAADSMPPLRVHPGLLGAGTPPSAATAAATDTAAIAPVAKAAPVPASTTTVVAAPVATPQAVVTPAPAPTPVMPATVAATPAPRRAPERPAPVAITPAPVVPTVIAPAPSPAPAPSAPAQVAVPAPLPTRRDAPPQVAETPPVEPSYSAHLAAGLLPEPNLQAARRMQAHPRQPGETLPTFIAAEQIVGRKDDEVIADGAAELRKRDTVLEADRLSYWQQSDELEARGNVRLTRGNDVVRGPHLKLNLENSTGVFEQPDYLMRHERKPQMTPVTPSLKLAPATVASGKAERLLFEGENHYRLNNATYSTCTPAEGQTPDWFARVSDLQLDYDDESGVARDATLVFKGTPILYAPWISFSLNNQRKSGLLTPTIGTTSRGGFEYLQPLYWAIAPDMDATVTPRYMSKRGVQWNGEYRYLAPNYNGQMRYELLPDDRVTHTRRSAYSLFHNQDLGYGFTGNLNFNGASDDTYFSDLSTRISTAAQGNLLRQGSLSYDGAWWQARLLAQSYQTLQDPALPALVTPYKRLPELRITAARGDLPAGGAFNFLGEHVSFRHPSQVEGKRFTLYPQFSLPLQNEAFYVTPKVGLHATRYTLTNQAAGTPDQHTRNVPIASVDAGVTFERQTDLFGSQLTQTLEPRLYYLYVPQRDQSQVPIFDTAATDFNFAQMFAENVYGGGDRIADANQVTAMVSSRLLDPGSGAELVRAAFGQRFYFTTQHVGLPGETLRSDRQTDLLAALSGRLLPKTFIDTAVQYNTRNSRVERLNLSGRYQPEAGKLLNAAYRYTRELAGVGQAGLGQFDVSGQWPFGGGWSAVGRYNYSLKDHRVIESIFGTEKDGGCWVVRFVVQRMATQAQNSNTAIFVQLELNGFSRIGSNPLELLKRNIPGYGVINQPTADPAFAAQ